MHSPFCNLWTYLRASFQSHCMFNRGISTMLISCSIRAIFVSQLSLSLQIFQSFFQKPTFKSFYLQFNSEYRSEKKNKKEVGFKKILRHEVWRGSTVVHKRLLAVLFNKDWTLCENAPACPPCCLLYEKDWKPRFSPGR